MIFFILPLLSVFRRALPSHYRMLEFCFKIKSEGALLITSFLLNAFIFNIDCLHFIPRDHFYSSGTISHLFILNLLFIL